MTFPPRRGPSSLTPGPHRVLSPATIRRECDSARSLVFPPGDLCPTPNRRRLPRRGVYSPPTSGLFRTATHRTRSGAPTGFYKPGPEAGPGVVINNVPCTVMSFSVTWFTSNVSHCGRNRATFGAAFNTKQANASYLLRMRRYVYLTSDTELGHIGG